MNRPGPSAAKREVFIVQRARPDVVGNLRYTEPDRVLGTEAAARRHVDALNRELQLDGVPFREYTASAFITGGEPALLAVVAALGLPAPTTRTRYGDGFDWADWWEVNCRGMTDEQRVALGSALDQFQWYRVRTTTLE